MNKNTLSILILVSGVLISGAIINPVNAQTERPLQPQEQKMPSDIQYPIPELGNCKSKNACKVFCDDSQNSDACLSFAEERNLMSPEELANAKKFIDKGMVGPGSCKGQAECDQYCGNSKHIEECMTFAQKNDMMSEQQLQDSQKVLKAIKSGLKPPACSGPKQCDTYCSSAEHMEECMTFTLAAGVVSDSQREQMQKTLDALKKGIKPPACRGQQECDKYCGTHQEECMSFSLATGMVPDNQKEQVQKTLDVFKKGIKPPACQPNPPDNQSGQPNQSSQSGLQACEQYCAEDSHVEECVKFSVAMGNMTEQQAQNSIKNGNKGPGGCIGKEACNAFCDNPDNQETCFNFGKDNGMIPQEDLQKMQEGQQKMKDSFGQIPEEVLNCITTSAGAGIVEKMKSGSYIPNGKIGETMNQCFQSFVPPRQESDENKPGELGGRDGQDNMPPGDDKYGQQNQQNQQNRIDQGEPGQGQPMINPNQSGTLFREKMEPIIQGQPGEPGQFIQREFEESGQLIQQRLEPIIQGQPGQMQFQEQQAPGIFIQGGSGEPGQVIQGEPGQIQPQQQIQIQQQPQPLLQPQPPAGEQTPPPPTSFLQGTQKLLGNVLGAFK
jgi:hypothetical protein